MRLISLFEIQTPLERNQRLFGEMLLLKRFMIFTGHQYKLYCLRMSRKVTL